MNFPAHSAGRHTDTRVWSKVLLQQLSQWGCIASVNLVYSYIYIGLLVGFWRVIIALFMIWYLTIYQQINSISFQWTIHRSVYFVFWLVERHAFLGFWAFVFEIKLWRFRVLILPVVFAAMVVHSKPAKPPGPPGSRSRKVVEKTAKSEKRRVIPQHSMLNSSESDDGDLLLDATIK